MISAPKTAFDSSSAVHKYRVSRTSTSGCATHRLWNATCRASFLLAETVGLMEAVLGGRS